MRCREKSSSFNSPLPPPVGGVNILLQIRMRQPSYWPELCRSGGRDNGSLVGPDSDLAVRTVSALRSHRNCAPHPRNSLGIVA